MIVSNISSVKPPSSSSSTTAVVAAGVAAASLAPGTVRRRLEVPGGVTDRSSGSVEGGVSMGCRNGISLYIISVITLEDPDPLGTNG